MLNGNPQAINKMIENNPNIQQAKKLIEENGGDVEKAFRNTAKQVGFDVEEFINMMR